ENVTVNASIGPEQSLSNEAYIGVVYIHGIGSIVLVPIGVILNIFVIIVIAKIRKLRTVPNLFMFLLSLNDFILYSIFFLISGIHRLSKATVIQFCAPFEYTYNVLYGIGIMYYCLIALNRYCLVIHNSSYKKVFNTKTTTLMIVMSWVIPICVFLEPLLNTSGGNYYDFKDDRYTCCIRSDDVASGVSLWKIVVIIAFAGPSLVMMFSYSQILYTLRCQRLKIQNEQAHAVQAGGANLRIPKIVDWKYTRIMIMIFLVFVLTNGPYLISQNVNSSPLINHILGLLVKMNGILNCLIYMTMNRRFKKAMRLMIQSEPNSSNVI
ncbi:unnamed protein product, partial [Owenia fusiformis]